MSSSEIKTNSDSMVPAPASLGRIQLMVRRLIFLLPILLCVLVTGQIWSSGELLWKEVLSPVGLTVWLTVGLSALFPLSGIAGLYLSKSIKTSHRLAGANKLLTSDNVTKQKLPASFKQVSSSLAAFLKNRYPLASFYAGCLFFGGMVAFAPNGFGWLLGVWFVSAIRDANIVASFNPIFHLTVGVPIYITIFLVSRTLALRMAAGFQHVATRVIFHKEGLFDAIMDAIRTRANKVSIAEEHPHLRNVFSISVYLFACYALLFLFIALCPPPFGSTINGWLKACVADSNFNTTIYTSGMDMRVFLASVIAAFGTVPLAIMSCALLPSKQPKNLIFSSQGILVPTAASSIIGMAPFREWRDLKEVSVLGVSEPASEQLQLKFNSGSKIKIKTASIQPDHLYELLSGANEYAKACHFDQTASDLQSKLASQVKADTLAHVNKFSSTIFSPRKTGDCLQNGDYKIVRVMARKPFSAVYLARNRDNVRVVVKEFVLPTSVERCDQLDAAFDREYELLRMLQHDCIARVINKFEEKGARYLVMEHIQGSDLRSMVSVKGPRPEALVISWGVQIAQMMTYLHELTPPVLHRDLTPDNLMEDEDGVLKLIDFGAAHQFMEGVTGTLIGKQCYIAPEQLRGKASCRSDIYSFGGTLFYFLTAKDPKALQQCNFGDLNADAIKVSDSLQRIVQKCTCFDESQRYESFRAILADLLVLTDKRGYPPRLAQAGTDE